MRIKNDAEFIVDSVESCIDALDELVIVYNDCEDNSAEIIELMRQRYPDKIRVFEYLHKVYGVGLSKEAYEFAKSLPDDSPALLCNYYNYALSKVRYEYAIKIDADQIYFKEKLKYWCDVVRGKKLKDGNVYFGAMFHYYFLIYRFLSIKLNTRLPIMPVWLARWVKPHYERYAVKMMRLGKSCLSFSGVNVYKDNLWEVSLGLENKVINILPPFNGEGDHLLFKVSDKTLYRKFDMDYYNLISNSSYSLIEEFVHPYKPMFMGFCWFHMNAMRCRLKDRVLQVKKDNPKSFEIIGSLLKQNFCDVEKKTDNRVHSLYQRILFSYIYNSDKESINEYYNILK